MLVLTPVAYETILDHARDDAPVEACGVLTGRRDADRAVALTAHPAQNVAATPRVRYEIDPVELLSVGEAAEAAERDVVGFYHSHPAGPPSPSDTDRREATWPDHHYVVASLARRPPTLGAWLWTGDAFKRATVSIRE